jgi:hypothetical protein
MGHTPNGKSGGTYQRCCQGLAQLGYLVLGFDPMGQGERIYYPDAFTLRGRLKCPQRTRLRTNDGTAGISLDEFSGYHYLAGGFTRIRNSIQQEFYHLLTKLLRKLTDRC